MKKAVLLIAALVVVSSMVFAAEPVAELKITDFSGNAKVTWGVDLGTGVSAFANTTETKLQLDLVGSGDKTSAGDNIWGEIKIKTDGDPIRIKTENGGAPALSGLKVVVDVAKLHIGSLAYIGIKSGNTDIDYMMLPDECAAVFFVDPAKRYGQVASGYTNFMGFGTIAAMTSLMADAENGTGPDATQGIVAGIAIPDLVNVDVDFRSINTWSDSLVISKDTPEVNQYAIKGAVELKAVPNLTAIVAVNTGIGGNNGANACYYDIGFGGKVAYKIALDEKMYVLPKIAVNAVYDVAGAGITPFAYTENATKDIGFQAQAGALLAWGDKSKLNHYFSPDKDYDWGYYPGLSVGAIVVSKKVFAPTIAKDFGIGLNVSAFSGSIVENLSANAALEIMNLMRDEATEPMWMGATVNFKYDLKMDPMTITPKFGLYFLSVSPSTALPLADELKTDVFVKAGLEIAKIFPNTTLSFDYASNDFVGGVGNLPSASQTKSDQPLGKFEASLKIGF